MHQMFIQWLVSQLDGVANLLSAAQTLAEARNESLTTATLQHAVHQLNQLLASMEDDSEEEADESPPAPNRHPE